jgi:hypothetical protein
VASKSIGNGTPVGESGPRLRECFSLRAPHMADETAGAEAGTPPTGAPLTVEKVAVVVSGISVIGEARSALKAAGWTASITANRITVDDAVMAQFIPAKTGTFGLVSARWVIYSIAAADQVWIVGA